MVKFLVLALSLAIAQISVAGTCVSTDNRYEVVVTGDTYGGMQTTLKIDGQEIPALREFCVWTPSIRSVLRCPHQLDGVTAEVYPRFPTKQKFDTPAEGRNMPWDLTKPMIDAKIVIFGQDTVALACQ